MTDNTTLNAGTGGDVIRAEDRAGIKTQVMLIDIGGAGAESLVDGSNPLPVTASALPLPTGAATAAAQSTGNTALASILTALGQTLAIGGSVTVSNFPGTQAISGTVTANAGSGTFAISAASLPLPSGAATAANQSTTNTTLGNIDSDIGALADAAYAGSGSASVIAALKGVYSLLAAPLPAGSNAIGTVTANAGTGTFAVSAASLPLPSGAATETTLAAINTKTPALGQAAMTASSPVVIASDQSVVPVNQAGVSASGSLGVLNATVALSLNGSTGFAIDLRGTFVATVTFQGTIDGTNWFTLNVVPAGAAVNQANVSTATAVGAWMGNANGCSQVRAIATAYTSGSVTVTLRAMQAAGMVQTVPTGQTTQAVSGTLTAVTTVTTLANGQTAHSAASTGSPLRVAGRVNTAVDTTLVAGDASDLFVTTGGALVSKPYSMPETDWQSSSGLTPLATTTSTAVRAAGAAGVRNYVTAIQLFNNSATVSTNVAILDGAAVLWAGWLPATTAALPVVPVNITFPTPLRGTAATAVNIQLGTTASSVFWNAQGYQAP